MERQDAVWLLDQAEMDDDIEEDQVAPVDDSGAHEVDGEEEGQDDVGGAIVEVGGAIRFEGHDEVGGVMDQVDPLSFLGEAICCRPGGPGDRNSWSE